jgi:hypothetical protein
MTMSNSITIAVPNAIILISDLGGGTTPDLMRGTLVASTPSCIAVGCMSDCNGETEVTLGLVKDVGSGEISVFEGELMTPNHEVAVRTILDERILQAHVLRSRTRVRIWVNHPSEPNKVIIGLQ